MRADAQANRKRLLDSATQLLAEQGPNVSMRSIAKHAGLGVATLHRHFPSMQELEIELMRNIAERVTGFSQEFCAHEATWDTWLRFGKNLASLGIFHMAEYFGDEVQRHASFDSLVEIRKHAFVGITQALHHASTAGLIDKNVPLLRFIVGVGVVTRPISVNNPAQKEMLEEIPEQTQWLLTTYLKGLRPA